MKEELYTIPVMDGFAENCECAFCAMRRSVDEKSIGFILSPAYMENEVRDRTNAEGFCRAHAARLAASKNVLGVSLMMQSHLASRQKELSALLDRLGNERSARRSSESLAAFRASLDGCYLCSRTRDTMERYIEAFFYLWKKEPGFRDTVLSSKGFCLEHFLELYQAADKHLLLGKADEFRKTLRELEEKNLDRVQGDLDWFIKKFDYRYADEPWKDSRDALPRTLTKVNGQFLS